MTGQNVDFATGQLTRWLGRRRG